MKKFFKYFAILCTCFFLYCLCEVIMEDDTTSTVQEEQVSDDYYDDEEVDDEDDYYDDEDYDTSWSVEDMVKELKEEIGVKDKDSEELIAAILKALKEDGGEILSNKTSDKSSASATTKKDKPSANAKQDTKPAAPAKEETKPAAAPAKQETKPAATPAKEETKPAATPAKQETKPAATPAKEETKPATQKPTPTATASSNTKPAATAGNRKVKAITGAEYKSKLADYTASKTAGKKGVKAAVLVYLPTDKSCNNMLESMNTLANEFPTLDLYSIKLQECIELAKAYGVKELPLLIIVKDGKVELHTGYLQTESLRTFLKKYN